MSVKFNRMENLSINGKAVASLSLNGAPVFPSPISFSTLKLDLGSNYHIVAVYDGDGINPGKVASYVVNSTSQITLYVHNLDTGAVIASKTESTSNGLNYTKAYYMEGAFWFIVCYKSIFTSYIRFSCPEQNYATANRSFGNVAYSSAGGFYLSQHNYLYSVSCSSYNTTTKGYNMVYNLFDVTTSTFFSTDITDLSTVSNYTSYSDATVQPIRVMALGRWAYITAKNKSNANQVYIFCAQFNLSTGAYQYLSREHLGSTSSYPGTDPGYTEGTGNYWSFYANAKNASHTYGIVLYDNRYVCFGYSPTPPYGAPISAHNTEMLLENGVNASAVNAENVDIMKYALIYKFKYSDHSFYVQQYVNGAWQSTKLGEASSSIASGVLPEGQLKLSYNMGYLADSATGKIYYFPING